MDLAVNLFVNIVDFIAFYILSCALTDSEIKIKSKNLIFCVLWGALVGIGFSYFAVDVVRIIILLSHVIWMYLLYRRKLSPTLLLVMMIYVVMLLIQSVFLVVYVNLPVSPKIGSLLGEVFYFCVSFLICRMLYLYRIVKVVETNKKLKVFVFCTPLIFNAIMMIYNLDYDHMLPNKMLFIIGVSACLFLLALILIQIFFKIRYYTKKLPMIHHETQNTIAAIYLASFCTDDLDIFNKEMKSYIDDLGFDITSLPTRRLQDMDKINSFINYKKLSYDGLKKLVFDTHVVIEEPHHSISEATVISMLAILLNNAMETSIVGKKIIINININNLDIRIEVKNTINTKNRMIISKMFRNGYSFSENSDDNKLQRYSFAKLKALVDKYQGNLYAQYGYDQEERLNCLTMTVRL